MIKKRPQNHFFGLALRKNGNTRKIVFENIHILYVFI